ncbi:MarR family transcriptional regulator [Clostridiaceae bacterium M8S5]|nr:MarR family transcriptional regulator [Clostridiaceae bacterium M8S5]
MFSNLLQKAGDKLFDEVTVKQWILLASILKSGVKEPTLSEIADINGYSRQNVKKLTKILEEKEFIQFKKDAKDNRVLRVQITDKCIAYLKSRYVKEQAFIKDMYRGITDEEVDDMYQTMKKLEQNISDLSEEG